MVLNTNSRCRPHPENFLAMIGGRLCFANHLLIAVFAGGSLTFASSPARGERINFGAIDARNNYISATLARLDGDRARAREKDSVRRANSTGSAIRPSSRTSRECLCCTARVCARCLVPSVVRNFNLVRRQSGLIECAIGCLVLVQNVVVCCWAFLCGLWRPTMYTQCPSKLCMQCGVGTSCKLYVFEHVLHVLFLRAT